jgi:hypothetical protein
MAEETIVSSRADTPLAARTPFRGNPPDSGSALGPALGLARGPARGPERYEGGIRFDRRELKRILSTYGRMVAAGEWRDYAIDFRDDVAVFAVYRRTSEMPLYSIEKRPKQKDRQGQYCVIAPGSQMLTRGNDLAGCLRVLERKLFKTVRTGD